MEQHDTYKFGNCYNMLDHCFNKFNLQIKAPCNILT